MDIAIVSKKIPPDYTGAGKRAYNLALDLQEMGKNISVITTTRNKKSPLKIFSIFAGEKIFLFKKNILQPLNILIYVINLFLHFLTHKYTVIHIIGCTTWFDYITLFISKKIFRIPAIVETTLLGSDDPISIKKRFLGGLKYRILLLADKFVNISPTLDQTFEKLNINKEKRIIIPNYVDNKRFSPSTDKREIKTKYGFENYDYVLLYVGGIRPRKNIDFIIKALKDLDIDKKAIAFVVVGPTDSNSAEEKQYYFSIMKLVDELNLKNNIHFVGYKNNLSEWYKLADIFLFASEAEGLPNSIIEAMASGLPVITTEINGIARYILSSPKDGIIVNNRKEFIENLKSLILNNERYQNIAIAARKTAIKRFNKEIILDQYKKVYKILSTKK